MLTEHDKSCPVCVATSVVLAAGRHKGRHLQLDFMKYVNISP